MALAAVFYPVAMSMATSGMATELALRTLQDAGFPVRQAARAVAALLFSTIGFAIEEQAHTGEAASPDGGTHALDDLVDPDTDACFEYGLELILSGMQATNGR